MRTLLIALLFTFSFLLGNIPQGMAQSFETGVQELSSPIEAPGFTLKEVGEDEISLKALRGKVVILNFFTTW